MNTTSGIQLYSGEVFDPLNPDKNKIHLKDIAHSLSLQCRFSGHIKKFYSVAEHCVRVSKALEINGLDEKSQFWGLMHDASEAYLVDLPAPIKSDPIFGQRYRGVENRLMKIIAEKFNLETPEPSSVKDYDKVLLVTEFRDLLKHYHSKEEEELWWPWIKGIEPLKKEIKPWTAARAEKEFLLRFEKLIKRQEDING